MKFSTCLLPIAIVLGLSACSAPSGQTQSKSRTTTAVTSSGTPLSAQKFAGEFDGTISCGDCQGILTKLQLNADGSYKLNETFNGRATNNFLFKSWTVEDPRRSSFRAYSQRAGLATSAIRSHRQR